MNLTAVASQTGPLAAIVIIPARPDRPSPGPGMLQVRMLAATNNPSEP